MPSSLTLQAQAKINLYLDILSRRENGYHNILSVMQSVGLCDTVTLTRLPTGRGICVETDAPDLPCDRRNLAWRAAERFGTLLGRTPDVHIRIGKRIPMAAGLAGGSADAAAVLRGLDRLYGLDTPRASLCELGATLGADIPFCIVGGAMIVQGIGEVLTPCRALDERQWLLIACGGEGVSTPAAYGALDIMYDDFRIPRERGARFDALLAALEAGDGAGVGAQLYNIFEQAILPTHTVARALIDAMRQGGAQAAMMSGSGPSVFGLFADAQTAQRAAAHIESTMGIRAHLTQPTTQNLI